MNKLFEVRDRLRQIYADYDVYLRPLLRFLFALLCLFAIKSYIGEVQGTQSILLITGASLICAFLPWGAVTFVAGLFILLNVFAVSYTVTGIMCMLFLAIMLLYLGFKPGKTVIMALVPLCFWLKIPYLLPLILGLSMGATALVPTVFGVLIWFLLRYVHDNAENLKQAADSAQLVEEFTVVTKDVFGSKYLLIVLLAFVLCILLVSFIRQLSIDHAWTAAIAAGTILLGAVILPGGLFTGQSSLVLDLAGLALSLLLALLYEHLFFAVDYAHAERLQFEDDDYYYYVKAVPKIQWDADDARRE